MSRVRLLVFGPPEVSVDGQPVAFRTRKALALLVYLLLEPGRPSRETLTALLWPDSNRERARGALRRTLVLLRENLGPAVAGVLRAERDVLALDRDEIDTDLALVQAALAAPHDAGGLALLRAGVEAYRGEFLAGFSLADASEFDGWAATQREHWHQRLAAIYDRLSALQLDQGVDATETAARWVAHDSLDETAHRRLMAAHAAAGDRAAALRAYEQCRVILERELGVAPDPETQALAARLRSTGVALPGVTATAGSSAQLADPLHIVRETAASAARPPVVTPTPGLASSPGISSPTLIGREEELAALSEVFAQVSGGATRLVVLVGEAGIGKTSLATAFVQGVEGTATVLRGRALELGGRLPYQPVAQALQEFLAGEPALEQLLDGPRLAEVSRLVPDLRVRLPGLPPPIADDTLAQSRLFEAVTRLIATLSHRRAIVLLLDDAQWTDPATRDVLAYGLRAWAGARVPVLVLLTLRSEEQAAVDPWLAALGRDLPLVRLHLPPLSIVAAVALVTQLRGAEAPLEELGRRLYAQTRGLPLLLVETIRGLGTDGELHAVPPAVHDLVLDRISRLGVAAQGLVLAAAVLGQADETPLWSVAALGEEEGVAALEEVIGRRLIESVGSRYQLTHDLVREVILADASQTRLRLLHRRALEALRTAAPAAVLAFHAERGGRQDEVARLSLEAGDEALALSAPGEATEHYERTRALLDTPSVVLERDAEERVFRNLGRARQLVGDWAQAQATYEAMAARGRAHGAPELVIAALNELAVLTAQRDFDVDRGLILLEEAAQLAARERPEREPETVWNQAQMTAVSWRPEAVSYARRALTLAEAHGQAELAARSRYVLSQAYSYAGQWEETASTAAAARADFTALRGRALRGERVGTSHVWAGIAASAPQQLQALEASCLWQLAQAEIHLGAPAPALGHARAAFDLASALANEWVGVAAAINVTLALAALDRLDEARRVACENVARAQALPNPAVLFWMLIAQAATLLARDEYAEALSVLGQGDALTEQLGPGVVPRVVVNTYRCAALVAQGEQDAAAALALELVALRRPWLTTRLFWDFVQHREITALVWAGRRDLALERCEQLEAAAGTNRRFQLVALRARVALAEAEGDTTAAQHSRSKALRLAADLGLTAELRQVQKS